EISRASYPSNVSVSGRIYGDTVALVAAASAEIRRIHERRATGVQLRHESIMMTAISRLGRTCGREIGRVRSSRHISVSGRVYGDTVAVVDAVSAEIGRVHERRATGVQLGH